MLYDQLMITNPKTGAPELTLAESVEPNKTATEWTIRVRPDITQEDRVDGLPLGTRGGTLSHYTFPRAGADAVQIRLARIFA